MKLRTMLYNASRSLSKASSILGDIETIATGDPKKISKRFINKTKNKVIYKTTRKISRKTNI